MEYIPSVIFKLAVSTDADIEVQNMKPQYYSISTKHHKFK